MEWQSLVVKACFCFKHLLFSCYHHVLNTHEYKGCWCVPAKRVYEELEHWKGLIWLLQNDYWLFLRMLGSIIGDSSRLRKIKRKKDGNAHSTTKINEKLAW